MTAIYLKELRSYFSGIISYTVLALMMVIAGFITWGTNVQSGSALFEGTVVTMAMWTYILSVPLLTMRMFAEEKKQKTDQLLYSLPLKTHGVVLGKFFAAATLLLIPVAVIGVFPLILSRYGTMNWATIYATVFSYYLTGCALIALGMFVSSLFENQIVAAIVTAVLVFFNYFMPFVATYVTGTAIGTAVLLVILGFLLGVLIYAETKNYVVGTLSALTVNVGLVLLYYLKSEWLEGLLPDVMSNLSVFDRMEAFAAGTFSLTNVVFYLSVIAVFVFLTVQSVEKRRWS